MKSYTKLRNLYGTITGRTTSTDLLVADDRINEGYRFVLSSHDWPFLYKQKTVSTVASTQFYDLPADFGKLVGIKVTVSSTQYIPKEVSSQEEWDRLNQSTSETSDTPSYFYILQGKLGFWPTPSSATTDAITYTYKRLAPDLTKADYTTGTITTTVVGDKTIVGNGTTWLASMANSWMRITASDTANTGDGIWYEIDSVTDNTHLELEKGYEGTAITAGTATYTIGQMPLLPENFHILPVYYAVSQYYLEKGEMNRYASFKSEFNEGIDQLMNEYGSQTDSVVIDYGRRRPPENPNNYITA